MKLRKEVLDLITVNEKIQSAAITGDHFSDDEVTLIRQCAFELLEKVPPPSKARIRANAEGRHA